MAGLSSGNFEMPVLLNATVFFGMTDFLTWINALKLRQRVPHYLYSYEDSHSFANYAFGTAQRPCRRVAQCTYRFRTVRLAARRIRTFALHRPSEGSHEIQRSLLPKHYAMFYIFDLFRVATSKHENIFFRAKVGVPIRSMGHPNIWV